MRRGLATWIVAALLAGARLAAGDAPRRLVVTVAPSALTERAVAAIEGGCALFDDAAGTSTSAACLGCHGASGSATQLRRCHPVDVDYPPVPRPSLRPAADAVARGVFLPDGKVRCVTCHDRRSPWDCALAIPAGARLQRAVVPGDARTYDPGAPQTAPAAGDRVGVRPLCTLCHTFAD